MDNIKNDHYYELKLKEDLAFIVNHMKNVVYLHMITFLNFQEDMMLDLLVKLVEKKINSFTINLNKARQFYDFLKSS